MPDGAQFCGNCGAKMGADAAPRQEQPIYTQAPPQPQVSQPIQPMSGPIEDTSPMSLGQYLVMLLLLCIPIANVILLFVWGFGSSVNLNKKNLARAALILAGISIVLSIFLGAAITNLVASIISAGGYGGYYY